MKLYCFNPEHDLAIANNNENFQAPESAMLLSSDLALLPAWYADNNSQILSEQPFVPYLAPAGLKVETVAPYSDLVPSHCTVEPWGWDAAIRKYIIGVGVHPSSLPDRVRIERYRCLSHRRTASKAMEYIIASATDSSLLPTPAVELTTMNEVRRFAAGHAEIVLKSPWSGSGKGVFWSKGPLTQSLAGWCQRVIDKQGCVMGEAAMDRIQDFAMEYRCRNGATQFAGYSLFFTEGSGIYRGNRLMSNDRIAAELQRWLPADTLQTVQIRTGDFISQYIAPYYDGYVGVDMFIYRNGHDICINPAVEVNLRMTMGMVARIISDRYVAPGSTGWFSIDHEPPGQLLTDHNVKMHNNPMTLNADGLLSSGYLSLCPILPSTVYRACVILSSD